MSDNGQDAEHALRVRQGLDADEMIRAEIARQDAIWGTAAARSDIAKGELLRAAMAQCEATYDRREGVLDAFDAPPYIYPATWSGFRDYGSDVANLAVAAAFLRQEMVRLILDGADTTRLPRRQQEQTPRPPDPDISDPA